MRTDPRLTEESLFQAGAQWLPKGSARAREGLFLTPPPAVRHTPVASRIHSGLPPARGHQGTWGVVTPLLYLPQGPWWGWV